MQKTIVCFIILSVLCCFLLPFPGIAGPLDPNEVMEKVKGEMLSSGQCSVDEVNNESFERVFFEVYGFYSQKNFNPSEQEKEDFLEYVFKGEGRNELEKKLAAIFMGVLVQAIPPGRIPPQTPQKKK